MSFLSKIKKFFEEDKKQEKTPVETIFLEQLPQKIEDRIKETSAKKENIKVQLKQRISEFDKEIARIIKSLEQIDISKRKEYEKIKLVVQQNLALYSSHLKKLTDNLKSLEEADLEVYISKIFSIADDFGKASRMPFEKATFLIGSELEIAKTSIRAFVHDVGNIAEKNSGIFKEFKLIDKINSLLKELKHLNALQKEAEQEVINFDAKIKSLKENYEKLKNEALNLKNSEDYKKDAEEKENYKKKQHELEKEMQAIRQKIDFKALARQFHHNPKKAQLIKEYSNDFKSLVMADDSLEIVRLVREAQNIDISSLKEMQARFLELSSLPITKTDEKLFLLEDKLKRIDSEIEAKKLNIAREKKKLERFAKKGEKIISELKELGKPLFIIA